MRSRSSKPDRRSNTNKKRSSRTRNTENTRQTDTSKSNQPQTKSIGNRKDSPTVAGKSNRTSVERKASDNSHQAATPNAKTKRTASHTSRSREDHKPSLSSTNKTDRLENSAELSLDSTEYDSTIMQKKDSGSNETVNVPVVYEDNHVIGVIKPVNILSQEDASGDTDMLTLIKQDLKTRHQKEGNVFLGLVHRLDRPVGGAMIFAKTSKGASRLSDSVRNGKLLKRYVAVVRGIPAQPKVTLRDTLLKDARTNTSTVVSPRTPGGKDAVLDYEVLATDTQANLTLVLIHLHTGRSHQIRVQMSHAGYPLFGDQRYGAEVNRAGEQLALWSILAGAPHPVKDEMIRIFSIPPRTRPWSAWPINLYEQLVKRLEHEQA